MAVRNSNLDFYSSLLAQLNLEERDASSRIVPITFCHLSELVDEMLKAFKPVDEKHKLSDVYTEENECIYKKVCFVLAEMKLDKSSYCARRYHLFAGTNFGKLYWLLDRNMPLPYPLALYLDSIGRFEHKSINYYPVPAVTDNHFADACYSCMPYMFTDILNRLADGVEIEIVPAAAQEALKSLPAINWVTIKNDAGVKTHIKLAPESVQFWLKPRPNNAPEDRPRELNVTHDDICIFNKLNYPLMYYNPEFLSELKNDDNQGNVSQFVRFERRYYQRYTNSQWYTMYGIPDDCKRLGILFGFGHFQGTVQPSTAIGDFTTAHTVGMSDISSKFMHHLIKPIADANYYFCNLDYMDQQKHIRKNGISIDYDGRTEYTKRNSLSNQNGAVNDSTMNLSKYSPRFASLELDQYNNYNKHVVPITFRHLSELVDEMLNVFQEMRPTKFSAFYTDENKRIYKKVCFILAEFKLDRSTHWHKEADNLKSFYCTEFYGYSNEYMRMSIPYPLALYLDSIGSFKYKSKDYVPVPALTDNRIADACYNCMPHKFTDILNMLANGVEIEAVPIAAQEALKSLPAIDWIQIKNDAGVETHIKLATESVEFWLKSRPHNAPEHQPRELNITQNDFIVFNDMNSFLNGYSEQILTKCSNTDQGNASQLVRFDPQTDKRRVANAIFQWYVMHDIPDDYKRLGSVFGFGDFRETVQPIYCNR